MMGVLTAAHRSRGTGLCCSPGGGGTTLTATTACSALAASEVEQHLLVDALLSRLIFRALRIIWALYTQSILSLCSWCPWHINFHSSSMIYNQFGLRNPALSQTTKLFHSSWILKPLGWPQGPCRAATLSSCLHPFPICFHMLKSLLLGSTLGAATDLNVRGKNVPASSNRTSYVTGQAFRYGYLSST